MVFQQIAINYLVYKLPHNGKYCYILVNSINIETIFSLIKKSYYCKTQEIIKTTILRYFSTLGTMQIADDLSIL